ncbi:MAG: PEP-CTERM sorting domain-containing protein, partial [Microcystis panniformis]
SNGELLSNTGLLTVTSIVTLGPRQSFGFENTFVGGFRVPEPTSTLSLLSLGILGAGATIKRKVKRSHSLEKEPSNVG